MCMNTPSVGKTTSSKKQPLKLHVAPSIGVRITERNVRQSAQHQEEEVASSKAMDAVRSSKANVLNICAICGDVCMYAYRLIY